jgi:hypothetical protein
MIGNIVKFRPIKSQSGFNEICTGLIYDIVNDTNPYYVIYTKRYDKLNCCYNLLPVAKQPLVLPYNTNYTC